MKKPHWIIERPAYYSGDAKDPDWQYQPHFATEFETEEEAQKFIKRHGLKGVFTTEYES